MKLWELADLATPWCVLVVATLRVAFHIESGYSDIQSLAAAARADPGALQRVLRHLIARGIFEEPEPGRFALNEAAREFLDEGGLLSVDLDSFGGRMAHAWSTLLQAVRTGKPAYHEVFGRSYWEDLDAHPGISAAFDAMMGPAGHGRPDPGILLDPGHWSSIQTVVDVGGGTGSLLAEVLRAHPGTRGILVDLPRTVARSGELLEAAGVSGRVTAVGQSFFDPLPPGGDIYMLKNVLHDWPDAEAAQLLRRCAEAARPNGRVVILGGVTPGASASPELLMLVLVGGKDRTLADFAALGRAAGLEIQSSGHTPSGRFIVECRPS
ncbi:MAG: 2,7-dihydroxy-5-methyl-1-naphthoate 7-O-methyltransferase [Bryobacteraceae bacterium]|nr:2,7-dihydroxy-5-methyl-1-naphthoate 7-O-methyltransferase [Bryobacteraceae bacterium]